MPPLLSLRDVRRVYDTGATPVPALDGVSFDVEPGEFVAIMGPSGSGKSTLLHVLGMLDQADSGTYTLAGTDVTHLADTRQAAIRNRRIGFIFQQFHLLSRLTARGNVGLPMIYAGRRRDRRRALEKLEAVGLTARARHSPGKLSGGEQQRVAIARALVNDPPLILADEPTGNLDTRTEEEILRILEGLNAAGKTLVIVTHEREVAARARRIITMRDGKILTDERRATAHAVVPLTNNGALWSDAAAHAFRRAELADHVRQAFSALFSHKLRSFLSMLGILIGVGSVIAMLAVGAGARADIQQRLMSLGSNLLSIRPAAHNLRGVAGAAGVVSRFTLRDSEEIARLPQVVAASPSVRGGCQVVYGNRNWRTQYEGVGTAHEAMRAATPRYGRFFGEAEVRACERVAVLGVTVVRELFGTENPIGRIVRINRNAFRVVGVLPEKGSAGPRDQDDTILVPITTAMYRMAGNRYIDSIDVQVTAADQLDAAQAAIGKLLARRHGVRGDPEQAFRVFNMAEIRETLESSTRTMTMLLGAIAAISLVVGGIGIMNIMLVSVTERTREIGLRKALGARRQDILWQFVIEAIVLSFTGGMLGVATGVGVATLIARLAGWTVLVAPESVVLSLAFSALVGLVFGIGPALHASRLKAVDALRYE